MSAEQIIQMILQNPETSLNAGVVIYLIYRLENIASRVSKLEGKIITICELIFNDKKRRKEENQ